MRKGWHAPGKGKSDSEATSKPLKLYGYETRVRLFN